MTCRKIIILRHVRYVAYRLYTMYNIRFGVFFSSSKQHHQACKSHITSYIPTRFLRKPLTLVTFSSRSVTKKNDVYPSTDSEDEPMFSRSAQCFGPRMKLPMWWLSSCDSYALMTMSTNETCYTQTHTIYMIIIYYCWSHMYAAVFGGQNSL